MSRLVEKASVLVALGVSGLAVLTAADQAQEPEPSSFCTAAGWEGASAPTREAAFDAWWHDSDRDQRQSLRHLVAVSPRQLPPTPREGDFVPGGDGYRWYVARDRWLQVSLAHPRKGGREQLDAWTVVGVNRCTAA